MNVKFQEPAGYCVKVARITAKIAVTTPLLIAGQHLLDAVDGFILSASNLLGDLVDVFC